MSDMLSQAEIDALLSGDSSSSDNTTQTSSDLTPEEIDALGEIGNISMGTSATTLSSLLGQKVSITTPNVMVYTWNELVAQNAKPYVVVKVEYTEGLLGTNLLILNASDVKVITGLMMGEQMPEGETDEITELHLSAISEAMNQMIGSASTSISSMTGKKIDISPPIAEYLDFATDAGSLQEISGDQKVVKISFKMAIGTMIDSEIMQVIPLDFAKELVNGLLASNVEEVQPQQQASQTMSAQEIAAAEPQIEHPSFDSQQNYDYNQDNADYGAVPNFNFKAPQQPQKIPINVQPAQFQALEEVSYGGNRENIGLIMDVPLQVTVELGRTTKLIREILEFGTGSIVELDKLAGEPVDILVNGKIIAKGEVVVIDENFGVRITDIVHPSKRL